MFWSTNINAFDLGIKGFDFAIKVYGLRRKRFWLKN